MAEIIFHLLRLANEAASLAWPGTSSGTLEACKHVTQASEEFIASNLL